MKKGEGWEVIVKGKGGETKEKRGVGLHAVRREVERGDWDG